MYRQKESGMTMVFSVAIMPLLLVCLGASGILLLGCSNPGGNAKSVAVADYRIEPGVGLGPVVFGMDKVAVLQHFGEPERGGEHAFEYPSLGLGVILTRRGTLHSIFLGCATCEPDSDFVTNAKYKSVEGIGMQSTREDVLAAYGTPDEESSGFIRYGSHLELRFMKGRVVHISLQAKKSPKED